MDDIIYTTISKLQHYIEHEKYKGYDPYDALKSPLFKLPVLKNNKAVRYTFQQIIKRSPFNIRKILFITKGYNPVTLGLCIQAYSYLMEIAPDKKNEFIYKADRLIKELVKLIPEGYSGACWGYDFDWEQRFMKIPAYQPTIIATGIITNALFRYYNLTRKTEVLDLIISAGGFIRKDLNRTYLDNTFCFSYSPFDKENIINANMKAVRLLSQIYSLTGEEELYNISRKAIEFTVSRQNRDGSWAYSNRRLKIDNYHTGYILDCIDEYIKNTGDNICEKYLIKGFKYYKENLVEREGFPKFYNYSRYPLDCTSGSQAIMTLTRFKEDKLAEKVAVYLINKMFDRRGYFYFRRYKYYTNKVSFMRWSNAWMLTALCMLQKNII